LTGGSGRRKLLGITTDSSKERGREIARMNGVTQLPLDDEILNHNLLLLATALAAAEGRKSDVTWFFAESIASV
jgi:hypothetical protein